MRFSTLQLEDFPGAQDFLRCVDEELSKADEFLKTLDNLDSKYVQVTTHKKGSDNVPLPKDSSRQMQPAFQRASPIPQPSDQLTMIRLPKLENRPCEVCECAYRREDYQDCRCLGLKLLKPPPLTAPPPLLKEDRKEQEDLEAGTGGRSLVTTSAKQGDKIILDDFLEDVREIKRNVENMQAALVALAERGEGKKAQEKPPQQLQLVNSSIKPKKKERNFKF